MLSQVRWLEIEANTKGEIQSYGQSETMGDVASRTATTQAAVVSLDSGAEVSTTPVDTAKANSRGKGPAGDADEKAEAATSFNTGTTGVNYFSATGDRLVSSVHTDVISSNIGMAVTSDTMVCDAARAEGTHAEDVTLSIAASEADTAVVTVTRDDDTQGEGVGVANADNATADMTRGDGAHTEAGRPSISAAVGAITTVAAYARANGAPWKDVGTI